jgi:uncharacterized phage protein (TIGR01671 family)
MREIRFRMWDTEGKQFMNDSRVVESSISRLEKNGKERFIFLQYTGLKDKKCFDIYEGDITREYDDEFGEILSVVVFENGMFQFKEVGYKGNDLLLLYESCNYIEIIGNIYENPELKEGVK